MTKKECFNLGYVSRKVGNKGDLFFVFDVDNPKSYKKIESVFLEINNSLVPFFIKNMELKGNNATVSIEGIDTVERAEELEKAGIYLPLNFLPELKGKKFYFHEIIGFTTVDKEAREIGIIEKVLDFPQQAIFQIKQGVHEILIPAKEEFIIEINRKIKQIILNPPDGLIDIYINNKNEDNSEKETDLD